VSNVKGFAPWSPSGEYKELLEDVLDTVEHLRDYWPLTQRTWLYRLMGRHKWQKEWEAYAPSTVAKRLAQGKKCDKTSGGGLNKILNLGRRAGYIPWEAVALSRGTDIQPVHYDSAYDMAQWAVKSIQHRRTDRQGGQGRILGLWIETDGMVSLFQDLASKYSMPLTSGSGFDTTGTKHRFAESIADAGMPVHMLHIGDRDPSGEQIHLSLDEDVQAFIDELGGEMTVERIAITEDQIDEYGLHWEPAKDDGSNHGIGLNVKRCAQAEAMEPEDLLAVVEAVIRGHLDVDLYREQLVAENAMQKAAKAALEPALEEL